MPEFSEYARTMLYKFMERYDEEAKTSSETRWNALPLAVRVMLTITFLATVTEIESDLY